MNEPGHSASCDRQPSPAVGDLASLLDALHATAAQRDRAGGHAAQEKQWIADAGLLTLAVPREFGGAGTPWPALYETIRATIACAMWAATHSTGHCRKFLCTLEFDCGAHGCAPLLCLRREVIG